MPDCARKDDLYPTPTGIQSGEAAGGTDTLRTFSPSVRSAEQLSCISATHCAPKKTSYGKVINQVNEQSKVYRAITKKTIDSTDITEKEPGENRNKPPQGTRETIGTILLDRSTESKQQGGMWFRPQSDRTSQKSR